MTFPVMSKRVYLSYCSENKDVVEHFSNDLSRVGVNFVHHVRDAHGADRIENEMADNDAPIFLFVSDNFLKSVGCMEGALKFIDNFKFRPRVKPIVIDGTITDESTAEVKSVPTKFDKVSNVIRYMNHWQDEYLRLRREKRTIPYSEEANFQAKIDKIRRISNEIGEFLRSLRGFSYQDFEAFKQASFSSFFDALGFDGEALKNRYRTLSAYVAAPVEVDTDVEVHVKSSDLIIEAPVVTPIEQEPTPVEETHEIVVEAPKFEIGEIPGLEMLPQDEEFDIQDEEDNIKSDIVAPEITIDHHSDENDDSEEEEDEDDNESGAAPSDDEELSQAPKSFQSAEEFVKDMTETEEDELEEQEFSEEEDSDEVSEDEDSYEESE